MSAHDADLDLFIGDPDAGDAKPRTNSALGEQCSSCANELLLDRHERMVYCVNDWYHG